MKNLTQWVKKHGDKPSSQKVLKAVSKAMDQDRLYLQHHF
jgi:hypothetical protein